MTKFVVLYTSVGHLTGKAVGDVVTITHQATAHHLLGLGLISELTEEQAAELAQQEATQLKAEQDERLGTFATGGGWYRFAPEAEGGEPVKVQGREAALQYLADHSEAKPHVAADGT